MIINASRKHQAIIAQLIYGLMQAYEQGSSNLFPYPETMIDESQTSSVPDVLLVDQEVELTRIIIEVTHTQGLKRDVRKLEQLVETYDVEEGFAYDYKTESWIKVSSGTTQSSSFSEVLNLDLNTFLSA